ncbi:MgtC family (plasmid) [Sinorhizobium sojae CCBAU 05684]|uniref:MgtC family n=3 Tax=Sinorhizobium sojae TaxID=716925 RepID=A0A249PIJ8_9HYPH|nr:MgtC/SapB family protein [Sinorhizobium sojae]ASY65567.1 MgtC family [Sinorhizobium sojae CCBAU 05684]
MDPLIPRIGLALAIGLLVGLERGWRERDAPGGSRTAGIRTYGISGLLGGVFGALAREQGGGFIFAAGFIGFALCFAWFKLREARHDGDFSVTGVVAALCVFALGGLAVAGDHRAAAAGGAAVAAVLGSREVLHKLLKRLSWIELRSALVLSVMTAIGLPLMPDRAIDPWGGFNPWEIWSFTVLSAAISFMGYIAVRLFGATRGLLVSGLAGALVSSTAVTASLGQKVRSGESARPLAGAACLAAVVSLVRTQVIVAVISPAVLPRVAPAVFAGAAVFALVGAVLMGRGLTPSGRAVSARNPFDLMPLLIFATLFALTATLGAALVVHIGHESLIAVSALSAAFDVDVAVLSALRTSSQSLPSKIIGDAVLAAIAANAAGRVFVAAVSSGAAAYWLRLAVASALAIGVGWALRWTIG